MLYSNENKKVENIFFLEYPTNFHLHMTKNKSMGVYFNSS